MKLISFCLWGDDPKYTFGAIRNAELLKSIYPDWEARFYCSDSVPQYTKDRIKSIKNCEVVEMGKISNWTGMFWRFYPSSEDDVEVMISRDTDSRLNMREKYAVDQWLASDKSFHIMRDHPWHGTEILGGMWGVKYPKLKNMKELIEQYSQTNKWGVDQNFLREVIWGLIIDDTMVHDEFFTQYGQSIPFPTLRDGLEFVGEAYDMNDNPNMMHRGVLDSFLKNNIKM